MESTEKKKTPEIDFMSLFDPTDEEKTLTAFLAAFKDLSSDLEDPENQHKKISYKLFEQSDDSFHLKASSDSRFDFDELHELIAANCCEKCDKSNNGRVSYRYISNGQYVLVSIKEQLGIANTYEVPKDYISHLEKVISVFERFNVLSRDSLTKLPNRRIYKEYVNEIRKRKDTITLAIGDAFGLKALNDDYSYHLGDKFLADIAAILEEVFEGVAKVFRYGGDEFVVISNPEIDAQEITKRLTIAGERISLEKEELKVDRVLGLDCGYATGTSDTYDKLWEEAVEKMKAEKSARYANNPNVERRRPSNAIKQP